MVSGISAHGIVNKAILCAGIVAQSTDKAPGTVLVGACGAAYRAASICP